MVSKTKTSDHWGVGDDNFEDIAKICTENYARLILSPLRSERLLKVILSENDNLHQLT